MDLASSLVQLGTCIKQVTRFFFRQNQTRKPWNAVSKLVYLKHIVIRWIIFSYVALATPASVAIIARCHASRSATKIGVHPLPVAKPL